MEECAKKLSLGLVASLAAFAMVIAVAPSVAQAVGNYRYCGILTQPYSACSRTSGLRYNQGYSDNVASYNGNGYISVCQKEISNTLGQISRTCNPVNCYCNYTDSGNVYDPFDYLTGYVGDNWPYAHTINGDLSTGV